MKLFNALRGGGNKDAMRQTTSLTMAYLLEQNARFETFMRQKVGELEAIVAQQQARHATAELTGSEPEEWGRPGAGVEEESPVVEEPLPDPLSLVDTRPVRPVMTLLNDFALDDPEVRPANDAGNSASPSLAVAAGGDRNPEELITSPPTSAPSDESKPMSPDPGPPPDWRTLLGAGSPAPAAGMARDEPETKPATTGEGRPAEVESTDEEEDSSSLLPAWLRQRQAKAVRLASERDDLDETGLDETTPVTGEPDLSGSAERGPELTADRVAAGDEQPAQPGAAVPEPELAGEAEGDWDKALDKQGPVGGWE